MSSQPFCPFLVEHSGILSSFKLFLELEPQVRDIIFKFYESKYASCLKMLDEMKVRHRHGHLGTEGMGSLGLSWACLRALTSSPLQDNLLLDMYLAPHVRTLYTQIRNRALIQVSVGVGVKRHGRLGLRGMQIF